MTTNEAIAIITTTALVTKEQADALPDGEQSQIPTLARGAAMFSVSLAKVLAVKYDLDLAVILDKVSEAIQHMARGDQ